MADLFDPSQSGGLMSFLTNPQTAGMLGLGGGLLAASGASRLPVTNGAALGMGLQGLQQGIGNAMQMRMEMAKMQSQLNPFGVGFGDASQGTQANQPNPALAQGSPVSGAANSGPMSGLSAGLGGFAPQLPAQQGASAAPNGLAMFGGHTPQEVMLAGARLAAFGNPAGAEMMKIAAQADPSLTPTDITKMGTQAGWTLPQIQQANANAILKNNSLTIRPGGGMGTFDAQGHPVFMMTPGQAPAGFMNQQNPDGSWAVVPVAGGTQAVTGSESAKELGKAQNENQQVWDPTANNGQGGFVYQTRAAVNAATNDSGTAPPQVPVGIRNNNFGNIKGSNGQFQTFATPQDGVNAADQLLASYGGKYGINTINGIAARWAPAGDGANNPVAKAAAIAAASGVPANQPINLKDPAMRARILPALFDTETPGWRNALQSGGAPQGAKASAPTQGGPMAAQPPLGQTTAANASQGAPSKLMSDSYKAMSATDANYQQSREALQAMLNITNKDAPGDTVARLLPQEWATKLSDDAADYEKAHALFTSLQGKALGSGGTDASRANQGAAVPDFTKPQAARLQGLTMQLNNLDLAHLKTQFLTPTYQQGNEKAFTSLSAGFDQNIKPAMMPIMQMSGPQQRAAVQAAVKANPALRPNFEWAFNNGLLK